jgi:hypothetical protein
MQSVEAEIRETKVQNSYIWLHTCYSLNLIVDDNNIDSI